MPSLRALRAFLCFKTYSGIGPTRTLKSFWLFSWKKKKSGIVLKRKVVEAKASLQWEKERYALSREMGFPRLEGGIDSSCAQCIKAIQSFPSTRAAKGQGTCHLSAKP
jgi:hypothetical protein